MSPDQYQDPFIFPYIAWIEKKK